MSLNGKIYFSLYLINLTSTNRSEIIQAKNENYAVNIHLTQMGEKKELTPKFIPQFQFECNTMVYFQNKLIPSVQFQLLLLFNMIFNTHIMD